MRDTDHLSAASGSRIPDGLRVRGRIAAEVAARGGRSFLAALAQEGGLRVKTPARRDGLVELAFINTGGGIAGGDRHALAVRAGPGARAVVTTPAAEKVYRSDGARAQVDVALELGAGAALDWLPQETILHDGAALHRRIEIDLAADAALTLAEMMVFGRPAHGERPQAIDLADRWRIRRAGRLVAAEALRLPPDFAALLPRPGVFAGANCIATILRCAPDAETRLDAVRHVLAQASGRGRAAASAWDGRLVVRCTAPDAAALRCDVARVAAVLTGRPAPRLWGM